MAKLSIKNLHKVYDNKVEVLKNVNIEAEHGEFLVLVGPSGCGKSTLLRCIAGLEEVTSGEIYIGDRMVNDLDPADRDIAMVFQDYALYPHMTVKDNLSFGLRMKKVPPAEIDKRVLATSTMLDIEHLLDRRPVHLSGGQRQRVAIGRAIVRNPTLFLFDEPLSNLDAKLRAQTRIELAKLHQTIQNTVVYVTHDQVEAMTLASRIVVLNKGCVQQFGTPLDLYHQPANKFVAGFIGNPAMNFFDGTLTVSGNNKTFEFLGNNLNLTDTPTPLKSGKYTLGLRPEALKILTKDGREAEGSADLNLKVTLFESHGHEAHLIVQLGQHQAVVRSANPRRLEVMKKSRPGDMLPTTVDRQALHWFASDEDGIRIQELK